VFGDWLDVLFGGDYEVGIPELTMSQGEVVRFRGSGHLSWHAGDEVRVRATTDGAQQLWPTLGQAPLPGRLIPLGNYVSLSGTTQIGLAVETTPVTMDGFQISGTSPHVVWNFGVHGLSITRNIQSHGPIQRTLRALLGPSPRHWVRASDTSEGNAFFDGQRSALDWLLAEAGFGSVGARQRSGQWFEVKVVIDRPPLVTDASELQTAITRAFSFAFGRLLVSRGHVDPAPASETRQLLAHHRQPTRNHIPEPLGSSMSRPAYRANIERLLGTAIDFFLTDLGSRVAPHLVLCWDTADSDYRTRLAVVSICLEGLVHLASPDPRNHDPGHTPADREALHEWLMARQGPLSQRFYERVRGFLGTLDHRRPADILRSWERRGVLGITRADVEAWQETRNAAAHGTLIHWPTDRDELQSRVTRLNRVYNVINRVVLQLMCYRGRYIDYSGPGWPEADFPAAPPDEL
jgi:hypothetical protein